MPAGLMHSLFSQICAYINTEQFFIVPFTVNVCCTQFLDLIYTLLTSKMYRLERLGKQKTKSDLFKTLSHRLQLAESLLHLTFLLHWLKKVYSPTCLRFSELMAPTTSSIAFHKQYFHYMGTLQANTEGACLKTVSNAEWGDLANM